MTLTANQTTLARMDMHATTLIPMLVGNGRVQDGIGGFLDAVKTRGLVPAFENAGIDASREPELMSKAGVTHDYTVHALLCHASGDDVPGMLVIQAMGDADSLNRMLRADMGDRADTVAKALFEAIESNWPHDMVPLHKDDLCNLLGIEQSDAPAALPPRFANDWMESERRSTYSSMIQSAIMINQFGEGQDVGSIEEKATFGATQYLLTSVYDMTAAHNTDAAVTPDVMGRIVEAYAHTHAMARYQAAHPAEQQTLVDLVEKIEKSAERTAGIFSLGLSDFDKRFYAEAFAERAAAAIDANEEVTAFLQHHARKAMGVPEGDTRKPPNPALQRNRNLS